MIDRLAALARRMSRILEGDILPFWLGREDPVHGGHYGGMDLSGRIDPEAPKSAVFVSRLLWTLSAAGGASGRGDCLAQAARTKRFLLDHLRDPVEGGLIWAARRDGRPRGGHKHVYAQAFGIYGLAAHAAATGDGESLAAAKALFAILETRSRRPNGSYEEAFDAAWRPVPNRRLTGRGGLGTLTFNTHLHLIEAYAALALVWPDPAPRAALRGLLILFLESFLAAAGTHTHETLDAGLRPEPGTVSYGHDIEASWLIEEAGDVVAEPELSRRLRTASAAMAAYAAAHGQDRDGGWFATRANVDDPAVDRLWWVQAEAVVGLVNALQRGGPPGMLDRAEAVWAFTERAIIDRAGGLEKLDRPGRPDPREPITGPAADPYHLARACLEIGRRAGHGCPS